MQYSCLNDPEFMITLLFEYNTYSIRNNISLQTHNDLLVADNIVTSGLSLNLWASPKHLRLHYFHQFRDWCVTSIVTMNYIFLQCRSNNTIKIIDPLGEIYHYADSHYLGSAVQQTMAGSLTKLLHQTKWTTFVNGKSGREPITSTCSNCWVIRWWWLVLHALAREDPAPSTSSMDRGLPLKSIAAITQTAIWMIARKYRDLPVRELRKWM